MTSPTPRQLPQIGSVWPLFCVDEDGEPRFLGRLHALQRDRYWVDTRAGKGHSISAGLPFFLRDLIPQGFAGRSVPGRSPELALPSRISEWNDDHVLTYLCRRGEDCIGDLILGEESLERFLAPSETATLIGGAEKRASEYPLLADAALAGTTRGSAAGGQHPKFMASVRDRADVRHVFVKFSPAEATPAARRWADLLIAEHTAAHVLHRHGLTSCTTELLFSDGRVFLEAPRFDRTPSGGRSGLVSLAALAHEYVGRSDSWIHATESLARLGIVRWEDVGAVRRLATFGRLIANTDMHLGNLSFRLSFDGPMPLAPVYDMLPMLYAPSAGLPATGNLVLSREFDPPLPSSENRDVWNEVARYACGYWLELAEHPGVSAEFAELALRNAQKIALVKRVATPAYRPPAR